MISCYLTADVSATHQPSDEKALIEKGQKILVIKVKDDRVTIYVKGNYYVVDSNDLRCR